MWHNLAVQVRDEEDEKEDANDDKEEKEAG